MRQISLAAVAVLSLSGAALALTPVVAYAQGKQAEDDARRKAEADQAAKKKKKEKEWATAQAPLADVKNAGPCPYVKVLYDASRFVEMKPGPGDTQKVGFTGEIQNVQANCQYKGSEPIAVQMQVNFQLGRGPEANGSSKTYKYWVAVTQRNESVLAKTDFDLNVQFPAGADRVAVSDRLQGITIPRHDARVSGSSFEILVGFDVTPQMADMTRDRVRYGVATDPDAALPKLK